MVDMQKAKLWFGQIEDIFDPLQIGRYRVRVYGYNTSDASLLPKEDLLWFTTLNPSNSATRGIGHSPTQYDEGSIVMGMYLDEDCQNGVILGSFFAFDNGYSDVNNLAYGGGNEGSLDCPTGGDAEDPVYGGTGGVTETPSNPTSTDPNISTSTATRKDLQRLLNNKNISIFLDLITYTEGTEEFGHRMYNVLYGDRPKIGSIKNLDRHPNIAKRISSRDSRTTTAAGAYQFLFRTWESYRKKYGFENFGPDCQRMAAIAEMGNAKGVIKSVLNGQWVDAMRQASGKWVSLPGTKQKQSKNLKTVKECLDYIKKKGAMINANDQRAIAPKDGMDPNVKYDANGDPDYSTTTNNMASSCEGVGGQHFPSNGGQSQYPYNQVYTSRSGHVIEYDDTPGSERINIQHRSGSYFAIMADGSMLHKAVGDAFSLYLKDRNEIITGVQNVTCLSDVNMKIDGAWNVKASQGNFDIPIIKQAGEFHCNEAIIQGTKFTEHVHMGVVEGGDISLEPIIDGTMVESMAVAEATYAEVILSRQDTERMVRDGTMTKEDAEAYHNKPENASDKEKDETPGKGGEMANGPCGAVPRLSNGRPNLATRLGRYITLKQCMTGVHVFRAQKGLNENQIYCNLKHVVENCFDVIKAKYPSATISSGLRNNNNRSQHNVGQALDIVFGSIPKSGYYNIAVWAKDNLPYDQLLLEYRGSGSAWLHVSLKRSGNRKQVLTLVNDKTYARGLVNYFGKRK